MTSYEYYIPTLSVPWHKELVVDMDKQYIKLYFVVIWYIICMQENDH